MGKVISGALASDRLRNIATVERRDSHARATLQGRLISPAVMRVNWHASVSLLQASLLRHTPLSHSSPAGTTAARAVKICLSYSFLGGFTR
eukprot:234356-Pleurochrysis_carterae.AAC.1